MERSRQDGDLPAGLGGPTRRALAAAGYTRVEQFTVVSEAEVLRLHGMGPKAVGGIRSALAARGLSFAENPERVTKLPARRKEGMP
nr:hypothetical protein [Rubrobacter radiotolerans]